MVIIVMTDAMCWIPIIFLKIGRASCRERV
jgi:hypothetical protein